MKKKNLPLMMAALVCALSFAFVTQAQDRIWGTFSGYSNNSGGGVYHLNKDGSQYQKSFELDRYHLNGTQPEHMLLGKDGNLYGFLSQGGVHGGGSFFKITDAGLIKLYDFENYPLGADAQIVEGDDGFIYGVGLGAVGYSNPMFRIKPDGKQFQSLYITKYGFDARGGLTKASNGVIYGAAHGGGNGFIYKFKPNLSGMEVVYTFSGPTGKRPIGKLEEGPDGFLYGLATTGGAYNQGAIFKVSLDGQQYFNLHSFKGTDGKRPEGNIAFDAEGNLYGMTSLGGVHKMGVIFKIHFDGTAFSTLNHFDGTMGNNPAWDGSDILIDGQTLYINTPGGAFGMGILFSIKTDGTQKQKILDYENNSHSGEMLFVPSKILTAPYLTIPQNNSTAADISGVFRSKKVSQALHYRLQLSKVADFTSVVLDQTSATETFKIDQLEFSINYYARVKSSMLPDWGPVTNFTTRTVESYTFVSRPAANAVQVEVVDIKVTANNVRGASHYTIEMNTSPDFSGTSIIRSSTSIGGRSFNFGNALYETKYYLRVKTDLSPNYGITTSFTTRAETFSTLLDPIPGSIEADASVLKLTVSPIAGAKRYMLELNTNADFSGTSKTRNSLIDGQNVFVLKDLQPATTYYARAKSNISTNFGASVNFATRPAISQQRLWGVTTTKDGEDGGTIFSFSVDSLTYTKHYEISGDDVGYLYLSGSLAASTQGRLFGVSVTDATGGGGFYGVDPNGTVTEIPSISPHHGSAMVASNNYLYILDSWINTFRGGIYSFDQDGDPAFDREEVIFSLTSSAQGGNPEAALIELEDGFLYGVAPYGGANNKGTAYRLRADGNGFQVVHNFNGTDGTYPNASLTDGADGFVYGMTPEGGTSNGGTLFKMSGDGSNFLKLHDFSIANGANPLGNLLLYNGYLYGMTSKGGSTNEGVIFRIAPDGSGFTTLFEFGNVKGANPFGGLAVGKDNVLFGMTSRGGANNVGVIFKIQPDGSNHEILFNFSDSQGCVPNGNLTVREETFTPVLAQLASAANRNGSTTVYPNPFNDHFMATLHDRSASKARMIITDMNGITLSDEKVEANQAVNLGSQLKKGLYILKVIKGSEVTNYRLIKK